MCVIHVLNEQEMEGGPCVVGDKVKYEDAWCVAAITAIPFVLGFNAMPSAHELSSPLDINSPSLFTYSYYYYCTLNP